MNDFSAEGKYEFNESLRMEGKCSRLAPEIYIKDDPNQILYPLHPAEWKCGHKLYLEEWPSSEFWKEIFTAYGIRDEISFSSYLHKIENCNVVKLHPERMANMLYSFGYSASRFHEIRYIAQLAGMKKRLFSEKKIPVKTIRLLEEVSDEICDQFLKFLLLKEVNGNIAREIINNWVDLTDVDRRKVIDEFENLCIVRNPHSQLHLQDEFRKVLNEIRFPEITLFRKKMEDQKSKLTGNIRVSYDLTFEENTLRVYADMENNRNLEDFRKCIQDNNNIQILEQLIFLLNHA